MQKWKMIKREIRRIFGKDIQVIHIQGSHIVSFKLDRINLNEDLLSKLTSSSIIKDIYIFPRNTRSNWEDIPWMECFASGKKEDKREIREVL